MSSENLGLSSFIADNLGYETMGITDKSHGEFKAENIGLDRLSVSVITDIETVTQSPTTTAGSTTLAPTTTMAVPVLQSITVEDATPTKIIHTYDLDLDETSVPDISDFAFSTKTGTGTVVVSGKTVTCTVTARYYWGDSGGTSAYTKGSNPIKSAAGAEADSFTATAITNNCALDAATTTLIAEGRYTNAPTDALKALINKTIVDLKADGVFAKGDCMYIRGVHESLLACQNWIKNAHNSTLVNSPTFTAKVGFQGNGSTSYINLNYTPSTEANKYALNDASIAFMHTLVGTSTARYVYGSIGTNGRSYMLFYTGGTAEREYCNSISYNNQIEQTNGLYVGYSRYISGANRPVQAYSNGVVTGAAADCAATAALSDQPFYELALNNAGSVNNPMNGQTSFFFAGARLSDTEQLALYTRVKYFFDNVGGTF